MSQNREMKRAITRALLVAVAAACGLSGCFVAQQMHDKKMEEQLLKPGALDPPVIERYRNYSYRFMKKYQVSHDWLADANMCRYGGFYDSPRSGWPDRIGEIYELDGVTVQDRDSSAYRKTGDKKHLSIDKYVRSKVVFNPVDSRMVETGLQSMCNQGWVKSNHFLTVLLFKRTADEWRELMKRSPNGRIVTERVGNNDWLANKFDPLNPPPINGVGGPFQIWVLSLGDTGYTLTLELGANQKSIEQPERHAQMQRIFKHLVESVKIEPFPGS